MLSSTKSSSSAGITLPNNALHLPEADFGFLDPGAGGHAHVQAQLAGIHGREEVLANERKQAQRPHKQHHEGHNHLRAGWPGPRPGRPP